MGHWNYRVCKHFFEYNEESKEIAEKDGEECYSIREVYYNEDGSIWATSNEPQSPHGESFEDLKDGILKMQMALDKEVIDLDTIKYITPDFEEEEEEDDDGL